MEGETGWLVEDGEWYWVARFELGRWVLFLVLLVLEEGNGERDGLARALP